MSNRVYLGIGSNIEPEKNIPAGIQVLRETFGNIQCSPVYQSQAVGFEGDHFYNLVASTTTSLEINELSKQLRDIEFRFGRSKDSPKYSARHLDIDILLLGQLTGNFDGTELPRGEILTNAFVLKPLADLAPQLTHPTENTTIEQLWLAFEQSHSPLSDYGQSIWPTPIKL